MKILLCTNGSPYTARALEVGVRIAQKTESDTDILVVAERDREQGARRMAEAAVAELETVGGTVTTLQRAGRMAEEVVRQAKAVPYDLVVIGSRGRRGVVRLLLGSVALHVTDHAPASILIVKGRTLNLAKFLVCSSAGPVSEHTIQFAGRLARALEASVTLLHVMSQLPLADDAVPDDLGASAEELIQRGSREGTHLNRMLDLLATEGQAARAVVRHGLVQDEVSAEAREGRYDLLVTGSHITPGLNSRLVDDLSSGILLAANCPVLIVRQVEPSRGDT
ncbi:MAG: universal stress protein [Chloroflexota bacterium]|nr:universal stress protein [Chloroflexota bacterium]